MNKRICFVTASPATVEAFLKLHVLSLANDNDVTVVTNLSAGRLKVPAHINQKNIYIPRKISIFSDFSALLKLYVFLYRSQFDVVISVTPKAGLLGMISAFLCRVPLRLHWFTGQVWVTQSGLMRQLLKACDKIIASASTQLLTDSETQRAFLLSERITNGDKLQVIHKGSISGVELNRFAFEEGVRVRVRSKIGLASNEVLFLFLGRLNKDKGVLDLAKAFSMLCDVRPDVKLAFVGPDEEGLKPQILSLCNEHPSRIYFEGFTDCPEAFYSAADIFVLPSYREGFGTSVIEAAALAVPSIGSKIYGLEDAIIDGETGLLFSCGDIIELYQAMEKLTISKELRIEMGQNARERVVTHFDSDLVTSEFVKYIYSHIDS